ncbi:MAG: hypothetical protein BWK76_23180 [Desulfobulbaceae bacterium A2]|nr:MAG: hypothetical protein BWK76_23180 [Desulfobulbaceae bacterium A2]
MEAGSVTGSSVQAQIQVSLLRQSLDMQGQTAMQLIQSATQPEQAVQADAEAPAQPVSGIDTYA